MGTYNFHKDLENSKLGIKKVVKLLEKIGYKFIEECGNSDYDLKMSRPGVKKPIKIEVKEDFYCERSGNVALEYHSRGKDSGIAVSKADYYIYLIHTSDGVKVLMSKKTKLLKMIADKKYFRVICGGDRGSNTYNYLFKYDVFIEIGELL